MDAGLAAVLGATVGAVGTGGAGIVAALLARSQGRSQLSAEYARFIREQRKAAYTAYTAAVLKEHERLNDASTHLEMAAHAEGDDRAEAVGAARTEYRAVQDEWGDLERRYAEVAVEGPPAITRSAVQISGAFNDYENRVLACLQAFEGGRSPAPDDLAQLGEVHRASYDAYHAFLKQASEVIGADGIRRLPE
ncbi:hypothetical protein [Streptomyces sporangiiformans]|uniref:Uncharacterized protein n=1 Tax=Streptomyces sporangiiformans TaxID=2315329 RepID=A0A505D4K3_9ACTN|nr:hypothetical protein [Streptomyces sporangiiformans]TPQ18594.1 hypothetical protein FGD71_029995 [Streptomyces sporangiiformans]